MSKDKVFTTLVFLTDLHIPYHNKKLLKLIYKFLKDNQPDYIVLGGDLIDFYSLSRFNKDPRRALDIQKDLDILYEFFKMLREICPNTKIIYIKGNHEARLKTYKWTKAPELAYLRCLTPQILFRLADFDIEWVEHRWKYGKLWFMHGDFLSKHSGDSARKNREEYGVNCLTGHSHRSGKSNLTNLGGNIGGWENGCLCLLNPEYMSGIPNWQNSFSVVLDYKEKLFYVNNIDIVKNSFLYQNKLYTLNEEWEKEFEKESNGKTVE
jgi:predicted phosphodiesterase